MGLFGFIGDAIESVGDIAKKIVKPVNKALEGIFGKDNGLIEKEIGIEADKMPSNDAAGVAADQNLKKNRQRRGVISTILAGDDDTVFTKNDDAILGG